MQTSVGHRRPVMVAALVLLALVAGLLVAPRPASAQEAPAPAPEWIFPVVGRDGVDWAYSDTWGACRGSGCSRSHLGVDIGTYGVKGVPVVAAASGTVRFVNWSSNPFDMNPERCCTLSITHAGGWETRYIHLDNDTPGTDDGRRWGIAPGIVPGVSVRAGQLIGWVGDSGNAENTAPHLHWEVMEPGGVSVNPTPHADSATRIDAPLPDTWDGTFWDDDDSVHQANIEVMADLGITYGCNPPDYTEYCPQDSITRGQIAAFIRRTLDTPEAIDDFFVDDENSVFESDINALAQIGIAFGCTETEYCPNAPLRREEMAELLVRTFGYDNPEGIDLFTDDEASPFEDAINAIGVHRITIGCNSPDYDEFCPTSSVTRAQMATFFVRALGLGF